MKIQFKGEGEPPLSSRLGHASKGQRSSAGRQPGTWGRSKPSWLQAKPWVKFNGSHVAVKLEIYTAHRAFVAESGIPPLKKKFTFIFDSC